MYHLKHVIRSALLGTVLVAVVAGIGYGAPSGSQTVTITAAQKINIGVPATSTIASTDPGACGLSTTTVSVQSNKLWNLQIRSEPLAYPNGKAKNGLGVELTNAIQYFGGSTPAFTNLTSTYVNLYAASQVKTSGRNVSVDYRQCVDWLDDPGSYTVVVEYLGIQP